MAAETPRPRRPPARAANGFNGAAARWRRRPRSRAEHDQGDGPASMGPPLDGGGDAGRVVAEAAETAGLQWGRRSMAAETRRGRTAVCRQVPASMGPPLDGGGDTLTISRTGLTGLLQWGRRSMAAETHRRRGRARDRHRASMGPPLDGGGDRARVGRRRGATAGFNGAAARWRRRRKGCVTCGGRAGGLQWGRRSMAAETADRRAGARLRQIASMGPPLDGGGDRPQVGGDRDWQVLGFNGAAARWRRRRHA